MKIHALLMTLVLALAGCDDNNDTQESLASEETIKRLDTPLREHGYSNLNTFVITDQSSYEDLLSQIESQDQWNNKVEFQAALGDAAIDFNAYNLLFYTFAEASGSIRVTPQLPTQIDNKIYIDIEREVPQVGTADVAFHGWSYRVAKDVSSVTFDDARRPVMIENTASNNAIPLNCKEWFDGCNHCSRAALGMPAACTLKACPDIDQISQCKEWF